MKGIKRNMKGRKKVDRQILSGYEKQKLVNKESHKSKGYVAPFISIMLVEAENFTTTSVSFSSTTPTVEDWKDGGETDVTTTQL